MHNALDPPQFLSYRSTKFRKFRNESQLLSTRAAKNDDIGLGRVGMGGSLEAAIIPTSYVREEGEVGRV